MGTSFDNRASNRGPLIALTAANLISTVGGSMSLVALPWFVYELTGDSALTGVAATCEFIPVMIASLVAGLIITRLGPRGTRVASDLISGIAVLAIPLLHLTVGISFPILLILVAVNGFLRTPAVAASYVLLRETAALAGTDTGAVSGPYLSSLQLAGVIGAPIAGATISWLGAPSVLVIDAATFVVSGLMVMLLLPRVDATVSEDDRSFRSAWRFLLGDRLLLRLIATSVMLGLVFSSWSAVLAPIYGQTVLHSSTQLGMIIAGYGFGAIIGMALAGHLAALIARSILLPVSTVLGIVPIFVLLAVQAPAPALVITMMICGFSGGVLSAVSIMIEYERIPVEQQGHVFGITAGLGWAGQAAGPLVVGLLIKLVPMTTVLIGIVIIGLLAAINLRTVPEPMGPRSGRSERNSSPSTSSGT